MLKESSKQKHLSHEFTTFSILTEQPFKPRQYLYHKPSQSYIKLVQVEPQLAYLDDDEQLIPVEPDDISETISVFVTFR
jgi:hypothetical protein